MKKTTGISIINKVQVIISFIVGIVFMVVESTILGIIIWIISIIIAVFLKGFTDIIDLLDSINNKLDKK